MPLVSSQLAWTYTACWLALCLVAALIAWRERASLALFQPAYRRFLLRPWKLATFGLAAGGLVLMAPYTGDPTWDWVDASFMAGLTFLTAPFAVGTLYRAWRGAAPSAHAYVAACAWLFSASWSYDLYLLLRDGAYPITWLANLIASSTLYAAAGLFWSLAWNAERGQYFAFWEPAWPDVADEARFAHLALPAAGFMLVVGLSMSVFLLPWLGRLLASWAS